MERASTLVRTARKSRLMTQGDLGSKARVHQSNVSEIENGRDLSVSTLVRLLRATGHELYALPTRRADVTQVAQAIRSHLKEGNKEGALRALIQLNDNLVAVHGLLRGVLGLVEPESTGRPEWDAAIAGLVAWRLNEEGLPLPAWVEDSRRFLRRPRTLDVDPADPVPTREDVPHEFAKRGVLVWLETFQNGQ